MEQNQFEGLEEVEQEDGLIPEASPELKEYEKLLLAESNRQLAEKAVNLVKFGCFSQKEEPTVDFSKFTRIDMAKKFKGLYDLYQNDETNELVFICPLVENNKGDLEEKKNMAPYAYDCIVTDAMDEETYQMVCKAAKNNISRFIPALRMAAYILYIATAVIGLLIGVSSFLLTIDANGFWKSLVSALNTVGVFIAAELLALPLFVLMEIKYRKYKEQ